jgi:Tfp pilus assembly protein PilF
MTELPKIFQYDHRVDREEPAPESARRFFKLGREALDANLLGDAKTLFLAALHIHPRYVDALSNFALVCKVTGRIAAAAVYQKRAVALRPGDGELWNNLGRTLFQLGRLDEAQDALERAIDLAPHVAQAWHNLGLLWFNRCDMKQARHYFAHALSVEPGSPHVEWDMAYSYLLDGDLVRGFGGYDVRFKVRHQWVYEKPMQLWAGEPLDGKTLWVYAEQGFGDTIMFARYLGVMIALVDPAKVIFDVPAVLLPLMKRFPFASSVELRAADDPMPAADYHIPLMSLARIFKTDLHALPSVLRPARGEPRDMGITGTGFRVGIAWAGDSSNGLDHRRSMKITDLLELAAIPQVDLYSLQIAPQANEVGESGALAILKDLSPHLRDWADTADAIDQLDMVVTVDTAVGHLAATLGKPAFIMITSPCDWRWLLDRDDSPWYPTVRLFRQDRHCEWGPVLTRVFDAVGAMARNRKG